MAKPEQWERQQVQDGEYTGPGDNPPGYAGDYYETNHVGWTDSETGDWYPVADCYDANVTHLIVATPDMRTALLAILADPHGCPFCDSGKLRNPNKGHTDECGFALAQAALAKAEGKS